jgi:hypothetical protein
MAGGSKGKVELIGEDRGRISGGIRYDYILIIIMLAHQHIIAVKKTRLV